MTVLSSKCAGLKNRAGNISIVENNINLPFEVKRVFYIYDIPGGEDRGRMRTGYAINFLWLSAVVLK